MIVSPLFCDTIPAFLQKDWSRLLKMSCQPNFQYDFGYMKSWTELLREEWNPLLLLNKDGNQLKGLFPLMYRDEKRRGLLPYRRIRFLGSPKTDFSTILANSTDLPLVIQTSLDWIFSNEFRWELLILDDLQEGNPAITIIKDWIKTHKITNKEQIGKYYYIDLNRSWDQVLADTSKKFVKRNINLARNRANKAGVWTFLANTSWNSARILREAAPIHIERQKILCRDSFYNNSAEKDFILSVIDESNISKQFLSSWLLLDGKPIAYLLGFQQDKIYYAWNMAFTPEYGSLFPSKLLMYKLVKHYHKRGFKEFHFMRGETPYKAKWTKSHRINYRFTFHNTNSIFGKLSVLADKVLKK